MISVWTCCSYSILWQLSVQYFMSSYAWHSGICLLPESEIGLLLFEVRLLQQTRHDLRYLFISEYFAINLKYIDCIKCFPCICFFLIFIYFFLFLLVCCDISCRWLLLIFLQRKWMRKILPKKWVVTVTLSWRGLLESRAAKPMTNEHFSELHIWRSFPD